ncbi:MAG: hypothetical protein JWN60_2002, partial [Acidobacteria bacterium]|nr:hypothetical protein [Acidobacteriota bacterium]
MKRFLSLCLTFVLLQSAFSFVLLPLNLSAQQAAALAVSSDETITNNTIIEMTKSGVSESVIIEKIKTTKGSFDTTAASLQELKKSGVSDSVILAIVQKT